MYFYVSCNHTFWWPAATLYLINWQWKRPSSLVKSGVTFLALRWADKGTHQQCPWMTWWPELQTIRWHWEVHQFSCVFGQNTMGEPHLVWTCTHLYCCSCVCDLIPRTLPGSTHSFFPLLQEQSTQKPAGFKIFFPASLFTTFLQGKH